MGSPQLTESMIDQILTEFRNQMKISERFLSKGIPTRLYSVRDLCDTVGISHTTFYRWLRAAAALKGKRVLTQREQLLRQFGKGIDKIQRKAADIRSLPMGSNGSKILRSFLKHRAEVSKRSVPVAKEPSDATDWDALTDELTAGVKSVEFDVLDSLKNM